MHCPTCSHNDNRVLSTKGEADRITRLRQCCRCGKRWKTVEASTEVIDKADRVIAAARELQALTGEV